ncbi:protein downstream neighbor of son homolog isoform X2 [Dendroctonus ponderosae]|uniref:Uncharacterized protein n=1 Tax=Dendroctonus ponderosae TaxID=77166 RepID=A0AAR5P552_DENPD|nr:protein downstream neighbor of son homolog isoform X2 [Dendroctonus ponderosae]XP_048518183.1 protein downstream neighbor of son homolog isoform X2 [Dendroctonus ponderosae]
MPNKTESTEQWQHPKQLLKLQKLKVKKRALQQRIYSVASLKDAKETQAVKASPFETIFNGKKRRNPFAKDDSQAKKPKPSESLISESQDETLYKILNQSSATVDAKQPLATFQNVLSLNEAPKKARAAESPCCPIDWTLRQKIRLISSQPFPWTQNLKISEESSGLTSFARCLDIDKCNTSLDTSPNAKFHQCCLLWQQPVLPWLSLFPRNSLKSNTNGVNLGASSVVKTSLYESWTDSFKSLYQLIRTRQCPYFYVCANSFTALFRAAGLCGYADLHAMVTPTTRGFRNLLKEQDIEFEMSLQPTKEAEKQDLKEATDVQANELHHDEDDEDWLENLGINADDIKNINYTQDRIKHKSECQVDSSHQSLILIEGVEVNSFFNFLLNCKSTIAVTGLFAGIPPTLLAPVAFYGATLNALKVRESKMHSAGSDYYSIELTGPILPTTVHNILNINPANHSITMTFNDLESTRGFSKVAKKKPPEEEKGTAIFGKENLSDCGLHPTVLTGFCSADAQRVSNIECLKYSGETKTFTWS